MKKRNKKQTRNVPLDTAEYPVPDRKPSAVEDAETVEETVEEQETLTEEEERLQRLREHGQTVLKPFHFPPGKSGNPNGRPRDPVKEVGQRLAKRRVGKTLSERQRRIATDLEFNPDDLTLLESLMLQLATSRNPQKIALYLERTYGKVPNINLNAQISENLVARFKSKLTDSELEAIGDGADVMEILFDKLPDVEGEDNTVDYIEGETTDE